MTFQLFVPILIFAAVCLVFKSLVGRAGSNRRREIEQFIEDEHQSNFARHQPIPDSMTLAVNAEFLNQSDFVTYCPDMPEHTRTTLETMRGNVYQKSQAYMVRLDKNESNIALKNTYGVGNLDKLIAGDNNLYNYLHALNSYAEMLINNQLVSQAKAVLLHATQDMQSDLSKSRELLQSVS